MKKLIDFNQPWASEVDKLKTPASRRTTAGSNKSDSIYGILRHFLFKVEVDSPIGGSATPIELQNLKPNSDCFVCVSFSNINQGRSISASWRP